MTGIDPHTSLAMTYLRAYADHNRTVRGMKRATRKAEHQLRMHWSAVATRGTSGSQIAADGLNAPDSSRSVSGAPNRARTISGRQTISTSGGHQ